MTDENDESPLIWVRECQECGNLQLDTSPTSRVSTERSMNVYMNRVCRRCASSGLDYGKYMTTSDFATLSLARRRER